ncbi:MAG: DEAD/DEAH box helicase, partial [Calditrichaeota bacterium]|nr:DEAD/DEAH box helicase [Calditrichota bacterium]
MEDVLTCNKASLILTISQSQSFSMPPHFLPGQVVRMRNYTARFGTIQGAPQPMGDTWSYRIQWNDGTRVAALENDLVAVKDSTPEALWEAGSFADHKSLLRLVTWIRLSKALTDTVLTRFASRIDFLPYQWLPLLKFLDSADSRILIADEVGLGKTIEAGIILRELTARQGRLRKVLVIARKGSLNSQWENELKRRFGFEFTVWEAQDMKDW